MVLSFRNPLLYVASGAPCLHPPAQVKPARVGYLSGWVPSSTIYGGLQVRARRRRGPSFANVSGGGFSTACARAAWGRGCFCVAAWRELDSFVMVGGVHVWV